MKKKLITYIMGISLVFILTGSSASATETDDSGYQTREHYFWGGF